MEVTPPVTTNLIASPSTTATSTSYLRSSDALLHAPVHMSCPAATGHPTEEGAFISDKQPPLETHALLVGSELQLQVLLVHFHHTLPQPSAVSRNGAGLQPSIRTALGWVVMYLRYKAQ